jgi:hypothetical protein
MSNTYGREESIRTSRERSKRISVLYITAAFLLSFGLMFVGAVTSYSEGLDGRDNRQESVVTYVPQPVETSAEAATDENINMVMYVVTAHAIIFMAIILIDLKKKEE